MDAVMRSNASFEVRMSHAVHKKRILERLSTSKIECFAEAAANGLTKTKLSRSFNHSHANPIHTLNLYPRPTPSLYTNPTLPPSYP